METSGQYLIVSGSGVTLARTIEELAPLWAECLDDPTAEVWAHRFLTTTVRNLLGALVLELIAGHAR